MNIVQEVLSCVLWFSSQSALVSSTSSANNTYRAMCDTHRKFSNAARLLIKGKVVLTCIIINFYCMVHRLYIRPVGRARGWGEVHVLWIEIYKHQYEYRCPQGSHQPNLRSLATH